jgi:uncharacterized membrane protein HdeD (DUF308 family)
MIAPLLLLLGMVSIAVLVIVASLGKRESSYLKSRHGILVIFLGLALVFAGVTTRSSLVLALTLMFGGLAVAAIGFAFAVWKLVKRR